MRVANAGARKELVQDVGRGTYRRNRLDQALPSTSKMYLYLLISFADLRLSNRYSFLLAQIIETIVSSVRPVRTLIFSRAIDED